VKREAGTKQTVSKRGKCRIIAGKWRGRILKFEDAEGLRPTTDRIRETVFNWLQGYIPESRCLDCFAGSGVLGFEALSRGASMVVFVETNKRTVDNLKENAKALSIDNPQIAIKHEDVLSWLQSIPLNGKVEDQFNLVFLDPPFHSEQLAKACRLLNSSGCLAGDAIIYVEHAANTSIEVPDNWTCLREKRSGQVSYKIFSHRLPNHRD